MNTQKAFLHTTEAAWKKLGSYSMDYIPRNILYALCKQICKQHLNLLPIKYFSDQTFMNALPLYISSQQLSFSIHKVQNIVHSQIIDH